jgi:peptidoglycan/LPS O-acetylase OafA/YrhL
MVTTRKYNPALDGIRALAITEVIARHAFPSFFLGWGIGVDVFFTLTGYLITQILLQHIQTTGSIDLKQFYVNRALRLMPPLWTLLLALLIPSLLAHHWKSLMEAWAMAATYLMNFNRAFAWWPETFLGHTWSLAQQEQFYILWPLIFLLIKGRHMARYVIGLLVVAFLWRLYLVDHGATAARIYNGLDTHLDSILVGSGLAFVSIPTRIKRYICAAWFVWPAVLAISCVSLPYASKSAQLFGSPLTGLVAACLIVATDQPVLQRALTTGSLIFTGRISYALYLWHYPLIDIAVQRYAFKGIALLVPVAIAYLVATLSYFTIEAYFRNLKRRLARAARTPVKEPDSLLSGNPVLAHLP